MSNEKQDRMWVSSLFKKKVKAQAAKKGMSVIKFTNCLAKEQDPLELIFKKKSGKKNVFEF